MKIGIGSDHAGFRYKQMLKSHLARQGHDVRDFGTHSTDPVDYPRFIRPVAEAVRYSQRRHRKNLSPSGDSRLVAEYPCRVLGISLFCCRLLAGRSAFYGNTEIRRRPPSEFTRMGACESAPFQLMSPASERLGDIHVRGTAVQIKRLNVAWLVFGALMLSQPVAYGATPVPDDVRSSDVRAADAQQHVVQRIDTLLEAGWTTAQVHPAPIAGDGEFLRRAYLDLTGVIPRVSEVRQFLADDHPDKRQRLVDELLESPRYATHMATTWRNRILPLGVDPERSREAVGLQKWLRTRFAKNLRYDNLVGELLLTIGGDELGPALYYQANDVSPEKLAASSAELFLGLKLECAQCHDHPFADWSQKDFWGLAAFFARVKAPDDRSMMMRSSYRIVDAERGDVQLPGSGEIVPPKYPRGDAAADDARRTRRTQLALWMTSRDNRYFARAAVNWAWSHLFGQGLVDSLDNVDEQDTSTSSQLLDELANYFVQSGFDLKQLWRTLASSRTYHLSSQHPDPDSAEPELFARMLAKPLTPEQLYDSFVVLAPRAAVGTGLTPGAGAVVATTVLDENPVRLEFVRRMRPPPGSVTEYRAGTLQVLMLMNGLATTDVTAHDRSSLLGALDAPFMSGDDQVETLFLAALSRQPDSQERVACAKALSDCETDDDRSRALSDLLWALVNSTEFAFNH
jgi:hypothetical protein